MDSWTRSALAALAVLATVSAQAGPGSATLYVRVRDRAGLPLPAQVTLVSSDDPNNGLGLSAQAAESTGLVVFTGVPPGRYRVTASHPFVHGDAYVRVRPGEVVSLAARLEPGAEPSGEVSVTDRHGAAYGTVFDAELLRDLPSSRSAWSLVETAEAAAITDRIEGGGLFPGEPALAGMHGSSWTQASLRLGDLDVTDPDRTGTPLLLPDVDALEAIELDSAAAPVETGGPGPTLVLVPRRPGAAWRGAAQASLTTSGMQSGGFGPGPPPVARFGSWADAGLTAGGPLVRDRLGLFLAGRFTRSRRLERGDPAELPSRIASGLAHLVFTPTARDDARVLVAVEDVERPYDGRARLSPVDAREDDSFLHLQSTWERRAGAVPAWSVTVGYERGSFDPELAGRTPRAVERLLDGPVPELVLPTRETRARWQLAVRVEPDLRGFAGGRHAVRLGGTLDRASASTRPAGPPAPIPERMDGLPARLWDYGYPGPESQRRATEVAAYASDRVAITGRLDVEAGLRLEATDGSAQGGGAVSWRTLSPRVTGRWRATEGGALVLFGGFARYRDRLPLRALAFGDPAAPQGSVFRWSDADGDGVAQPSEVGPLVARVGPGAADGRLASIDPGLRRPRTDEVHLGLEARLGGSLTLRFAGLHRRQRDLLESVNVGVPFAAYAVALVPDPGGDLLGPQDDQLLPLYDRAPGSFGQDRYLLTNPRDHTTLYESLELALAGPLGQRLQLLVGATASRAEDYGGNRGFRALENDQGMIGEQFDEPNAATFGRGRLFFDRAYTVKIAASWRAPWDVRLGAVARYQDGQPFARLVVASGLGQGPEAVQAIPNGRSRFGYTLTIDARLEKGIARGRRRAAVVLEAFNLLDTRREVEEDVVTGPRFRETTAVQPPRALRVGLRLEL